MKVSVKFSIGLIFILGITTCSKDDNVNVIETEISYETFTDNRDGQVYKSVNIGNQIWMAENLNYKTDSGSWVYAKIASNAPIYGRLYNWKTACDICPDGWHLPSETEWMELINYVKNDGHSGTEGIALKSTSGWYSNGNGTDNYGFAALPGGCRYAYGTFYHLGYYTYFWNSTDYGSYLASYYILGYFNSNIIFSPYGDTVIGLSVRCIKNK